MIATYLPVYFVAFAFLTAFGPATASAFLEGLFFFWVNERTGRAS